MKTRKCLVWADCSACIPSDQPFAGGLTNIKLISVELRHLHLKDIPFTLEKYKINVSSAKGKSSLYKSIGPFCLKNFPNFGDFE